MTFTQTAKSFLITALLFGASVCSAYDTPIVTQTKPSPPASVIYIGNSFFYFNNGMDGHVKQFVMAANKDQPWRSTMVTIGGSGLDWHNVEAYFAPNGIAKYSFSATNEVKFNKLDKLFEVAIIMDCSQCPIHPELKASFDEYVKKHGATIRKNGADPVLFMSWAYADKPEMTQQLADAYVKAGNANGMMVIPAGLAFAKSIAMHPEINLYFTDKRHPSLAGTYLGAAVVYASLFGQSPVGSSYTAGLDPAIATKLQNVAWETVKSFYKFK